MAVSYKRRRLAYLPIESSLDVTNIHERVCLDVIEHVTGTYLRMCSFQTPTFISEILDVQRSLSLKPVEDMSVISQPNQNIFQPLLSIVKY